MAAYKCFKDHSTAPEGDRRDAQREKARINRALRKAFFSGDESYTPISKRVVNFVFAGAVAAGALFCPATALADQPLTASYVTTISQTGTDASTVQLSSKREKKANASISPPVADAQGRFPSLDDYIGLLTCSGCGKHCPLTAPQCGVGSSQYEQAVALYENTVSSSQSAQETQDTVSTPTPEGESSDSSTISSSQDDKSSAPQSAVSDQSAALQEYLSKLFCSGCGRHCPLTAPQCAKGQAYVEQATAEFEAQNTSATDSTGSATDVTAESLSARGLFDDVMEYMPIGGLVVGGMYYTIVVKQKKKDEGSSKDTGEGRSK